MTRRHRAARVHLPTLLESSMSEFLFVTICLRSSERQNCTEVYDFPATRAEREEIVKFIHARLPCVPIKVIRANSFEPEAKVLRMRTNDANQQLIGAVVFKDHEAVEFREVKYFATAYQGSGFGAKLMDELKRDCVKDNLFFMVLYASNTAVQFFAKQKFLNFPDQIVGLSKTVVLSRVEQYQRSTLMATDLTELFPDQYKGVGKRLNKGDDVFVSHGNRHPRDEEGVVIDTKGALKVKVRYPKWTPDTDEWIVTAAKRLSVKEPVDNSVQETDSSRIKRIRII